MDQALTTARQDRYRRKGASIATWGTVILIALGNEKQRQREVDGKHVHPESLRWDRPELIVLARLLLAAHKVESALALGGHSRKLAHRSVLLLDELPDFSRSVLQSYGSFVGGT